MKILSFKRIEKKYLINQSQYEELLKGIRDHMKLDPYCENNKHIKSKIFTMIRLIIL